MGYTNKITSRAVFVDKLSSGEVATFCGANARTVKRRAEGMGGVNDAGYHIYTVAEALEIFIMINSRKARASELLLLLVDMGMSNYEELSGLILKMYVRQLVENSDPRDQDLI